MGLLGLFKKRSEIMDFGADCVCSFLPRLVIQAVNDLHLGRHVPFCSALQKRPAAGDPVSCPLWLPYGAHTLDRWNELSGKCDCRACHKFLIGVSRCTNCPPGVLAFHLFLGVLDLRVCRNAKCLQ
jgi:hypothetical protein